MTASDLNEMIIGGFSSYQYNIKALILQICILFQYFQKMLYNYLPILFWFRILRILKGNEKNCQKANIANLS